MISGSLPVATVRREGGARRSPYKAESCNYGRRVPTEGQPNPYPDPSRPLDRNLAGLETNTRAGDSLSNPTRQSRRAGRIEKSTALTVPRHSSTAVSNVCYILWAILQSWRRAKGTGPKALRSHPLVALW